MQLVLSIHTLFHPNLLFSKVSVFFPLKTRKSTRFMNENVNPKLFPSRSTQKYIFKNLKLLSIVNT